MILAGVRTLAMWRCGFVCGGGGGARAEDEGRGGCSPSRLAKEPFWLARAPSLLHRGQPPPQCTTAPLARSSLNSELRWPSKVTRSWTFGGRVEREKPTTATWRWRRRALGVFCILCEAQGPSKSVKHREVEGRGRWNGDGGGLDAAGLLVAALGQGGCGLF